MSDRRTWTDEAGVLRTTEWPDSDRPPTCSVIIERGQIAGVVMGSDCKLLIAAPPGYISPMLIKIVRPDPAP